jgi:hypothetical protein
MEFDRPFHHLALDIFGKELEPAISLNALDRKRLFLHDALKKGQRALCVLGSINAKNLTPAAIIDRRELINSGHNFADIHLHALTWDGTRRFSNARTTQARLFKALRPVPNERAMDGIERERQVMLTDELIAQTLHAKATLATQIEDESVRRGVDFARSGPQWRSALFDETAASPRHRDTEPITFEGPQRHV